MNGSTENEGRIEVRKNNESWGIVCDDFFDINDGDVFCKMLGYTNGAETVYLQSHFGHSNLSYHLDDLQCTGEEESFLDCHLQCNGEEESYLDCPILEASKGWDSHNCEPGEAAGVKCYPSEYVLQFIIIIYYNIIYT